MKTFALIVLFIINFTLFGQVIENGGFENGPTVTGFGQMYKANFWADGCWDAGSLPQLYDCQATPQTSGPFAGLIIGGTPAGCIYPRNNGSTNCRFGSISCLGTFGATTGPGTSIWNKLSSDLLPNVTYELQAWVARTQFIPPPVGTNSWPTFRRIEVVLRATNDAFAICDNEIVVPIPIDIVFNNCNWMFISTTFQLTPAQSALGYDFIEFRELPRSNYSTENIYIDDVMLLGGPVGLSPKDTEAFSFRTVNIYPNPASSELNIETELAFESAVIMDLMGKELIVSSDSKTISLENLSAGVYIIQLENNGELYSQRFVKQ